MTAVPAHGEPPATTGRHGEPPATTGRHHEPPATTGRHHEPPATTGRRGERAAGAAALPAGHPGQPGGGPGSLAHRQAALVEALTSGRPVPEGFDASRIEAARVALLRKRAGEVARQWPLLAAGLGSGWTSTFAGWAATRPTRGSLRDGWDLARELAERAALPAPAAAELAEREAVWHYDGAAAPRRRRLPAVRRVDGAVVLQIGGRLRVVRRL